MTDSAKPKLLTGGNPQIPKGDGDAPVQAYIAAMPGWKQEIGRRIDELVERVFPKVQKAVKWNRPLYGREDGWFMTIYCYTKYVQLTFLRGTSLKPVPPVESKVEGRRYFNIYEDDELEEAQIANWVKQAAKLPGAEL